MKIISIQVGMPKTVNFRGREVTTGIFKNPVAGPVNLRQTNIEGDGQADLRVHGGPEKAVYAYSMDSLPAWQLKRPTDVFEAGSFGENLSVDILHEDKIFVGDRFQVGTAIIKAVQPRFPCFKLGVKFNDASIMKDFMKMNRPGVYYSVEQEGTFQAGDEFRFLGGEQKKISIGRLFELVQESDVDPVEYSEIMSIKSLPVQMRQHFLSLRD